MSEQQLRRIRLRAANALLRPLGYRPVKEGELVDFYLHKYSSYEEYRDTQIFYNMEKINNVWADEVTLKELSDQLKKRIPREVIRGICHGTRNGFEQNFLNKQGRIQAIGTDISPTATDYENSVQWDFHNVNPEWISSFDFVYSNSLDQSWNPRSALVAWLNQIKDDGYVVLEHTPMHGPKGASKMDPFGVRPTVMPYVLVEWFGQDISLDFYKGKKGNMDLDVWLFFIKKHRTEIR